MRKDRSSGVSTTIIGCRLSSRRYRKSVAELGHDAVQGRGVVAVDETARIG